MSNRLLVSIFAISLIIFLSMTYWLTSDHGFTFDATISEWVESTSSPWVVNVMEGISLIGSSEVILIVTLLVAGIFVLKRDWYHTLLFLTVSVGGVALNLILKLVFQRERPDGEVSYIEVFNMSIEIPSYSYPSGHTMRAAIFILFLIYLSLRYIMHAGMKIIVNTVLFLTLIGVACSRLYVEAHFLTDTLGAIFISLAWSSLCLLLFKRYDPSQRRTYFVIGK